MRGRPTALGAVLLTGLLMGCGITESDPIEAGSPASVRVIPGGERRLLLFFRSGSGALAPVARPGESRREGRGTRPEPWVTRAVNLLFAGPVAHEQTAGLRSGLPKLPPRSWVVAKPTEPTEYNGIALYLPIPLADLDDTAIRQLVCTAGFAGDPTGMVAVHLLGTDGAMKGSNCDADVDDGRRPSRPSMAPDSRPLPVRPPGDRSWPSYLPRDKASPPGAEPSAG